MTTSIYLAARYSRRTEMLEHREALNALGYIVTSRWIEGLHVLSPDGAANEHGDQGAGAIERGQFATVDLDDVTQADTLIAFTEEPRTASRGGRHVELGIAIGHGKRVIVVGPRENVFCCLPEIEHFPRWSECLARLQLDRAVQDAQIARVMAERAASALERMRDQIGQISACLDMARPDHPYWSRGQWPGANALRAAPMSSSPNAAIISSMDNGNLDRTGKEQS